MNSDNEVVAMAGLAAAGIIALGGLVYGLHQAEVKQALDCQPQCLIEGVQFKPSKGGTSTGCWCDTRYARLGGVE